MLMVDPEKNAPGPNRIYFWVETSGITLPLWVWDRDLDQAERSPEWGWALFIEVMQAIKLRLAADAVWREL